LGDDRNVFLREELLHKWSMVWCIIVLQKPLSLLLLRTAMWNLCKPCT
jgi:hypothetical protein